MQIKINAVQLAGTRRYEDIFAFHSSSDSSVFYQESLVPFFLMLMTASANAPEKTSLSIFTPDSQIFVPSGGSVSGRGHNSQHQHNCFEFTYVLEGSMYQIVEGKRYFYPTGSCCLMNRNTLHTEEFSTDYTCIFLSVSTEFVHRLMDSGLPLLFPNEQDLYENLIFRFFRQNMENSDADGKDFLDFIPKISRTEQEELVHQIFEDLLYTLIEPGHGAGFRLLELLSRFIGILSDPECYSGEHVTAQSNMESLLFARINRLLSERRGRVSNAELAVLLSYNGSYLGRIVKKYTGKSLFDYSMIFTMKAASDLLLNSSLSVSRIAAELRFSNLTHFYRLFTEHFGMTPRGYRQKYRPDRRDPEKDAGPLPR